MKWVIFSVVLVVAGGLILNSRSGNIAKPAPPVSGQVSEPTSTSEPTPTATPVVPSPTLPQLKPKEKSTNSGTSGITRGQISCNYQVPATPNSQGEAELSANWNNLVTGKNGTAQAAVCVSINGDNGKIMSIIPKANGSTTVGAPWISLDGNYNFLLYDQHGGDLPNCTGTPLAACRINTNR